MFSCWKLYVRFFDLLSGFLDSDSLTEMVLISLSMVGWFCQLVDIQSYKQKLPYCSFRSLQIRKISGVELYTFFASFFDIGCMPSQLPPPGL